VWWNGGKCGGMGGKCGRMGGKCGGMVASVMEWW
jgi:hypothetical protein